MEFAENSIIGRANEERSCVNQLQHKPTDEIQNKKSYLNPENEPLSLNNRDHSNSDEGVDFVRKSESKKREHSDETDSESKKDYHKCIKLNCDNSPGNCCNVNLNVTDDFTYCSNVSTEVKNEGGDELVVPVLCDTNILLVENSAEGNNNPSDEVLYAESSDFKNAEDDNISKMLGTESSSESKFSPSTSHVSASSEEATNSGNATRTLEVEENMLFNDNISLLDSITSSSGSSSSSSLTSLFSSLGGDENDFDLVFNEGISSDDEINSESTENILPSVLKKTLPADKFSFPREILLRQINGGDSKRRKFSKFDTKFYASRSMVQRLDLYKSLKKHEGCVNTVAFNDTGNLLISASNDRHACLWNWAEDKSLLYFSTGHTANVYQAKFLPHSNDTQLITCGQDHQVRMCLLNEAGLESTSLLTTHVRPVYKISMQPQMPHSFLTAGEDGVVNAIDVRENNTYCKKLLKPSRQRFNPTAIVCLYSIHCNPIKNYEFIVCGNCEEIRLYDQRNISKKKQSPVKEFRLGREFTERGEFLCNRSSTTVTSAVYNYNGTEILASYNDNDIFLFNNHDSTRYVFRYDGHRNFATIKGVNYYGPRSEYIVSGSDCGYIYIWDKKSESIVQWMKGDKDIANCLEPHPSFPVLATSGLESEVKIWMPMTNRTHNLIDSETFQKVVKRNSFHKLIAPRPDGEMSLFELLASVNRENFIRH